MLAHKRASHLHAWLVMKWTVKVKTISNVCFCSVVSFERKHPQKEAHFSACFQMDNSVDYQVQTIETNTKNRISCLKFFL